MQIEQREVAANTAGLRSDSCANSDPVDLKPMIRYPSLATLVKNAITYVRRKILAGTIQNNMNSFPEEVCLFYAQPISHFLMPRI